MKKGVDECGLEFATGEAIIRKLFLNSEQTITAPKSKNTMDVHKKILRTQTLKSI